MRENEKGTKILIRMLMMWTFTMGILMYAMQEFGMQTAYALTSEDGIWEYSISSEDNTGIIRGYVGDETDLTLPSEIDGVKVKTVGGKLFLDNEDLTSVTISEGITKIEFSAFKGCSELKSVILPESLTTMERLVFKDCTSLTSITIPGNLTKIGDQAFSGCTNLSSLTIMEGVGYIDNRAFSECKSLVSVDIPGSVETISSGAFRECANLSHLTFGEGIKTISLSAFIKCEKLISLKIPGSLTTIDGSAFSGCSGLVSVVLGEGVEEISYSAFSGCENLRLIVIPETVQLFGSNPFNNCDKLTICSPLDSIAYEYAMYEEIPWMDINEYPRELQEEDISLDVISYVYDGTEKKPNVSVEYEGEKLVEGIDYLVTYENNVDIGIASVIVEGITFYSGTIKKEYIISYGIKAKFEDTEVQGDWEYATMLDGTVAITKYLGTETDVMIPNKINGAKVTCIGMYAFVFQKDIQNVVIPNSVVSIMEGAFLGCTGLTSMVIPSCVIGEYVFGDCSELKEVRLLNGVKYIGAYTFSSCAKLETLYFPETMLYIDGCTFIGCNGLKNVKLPKGITSIESSTFQYCSNLTEITIPDTVTRIGKGAFESTKITSLIIPKSVKQIEAGAFWGCRDLENIVVSEENDYYSSEAGILYDKKQMTFVACPAKKQGRVEIKEGVTDIASEAFINCANVVEIVFPASLKNIEDVGMFATCSSLSNIEVSADNPYYSSEDGILYDKEKTSIVRCLNTKLGDLMIPESVTQIKDSAFTSCKISNVWIPDSVVSIAQGAFSKYDKLVIWSSPSSYAYQYAKERGIRWESTEPAPINIEKVSLKTSTYTYNGYAKKPVVTVKAGSKTLVNGTDFTVTYSNNINPGIAKITVTGKGAYTGTLTKTFRITPAKVKNFKQSTIYATTKITMSWTKVPGVTGYAVYRANSKNGTYKYLKTTTTNSCANAGLKAGIKYYYKVRAYKTVDGKKIYGAFSEAKSMLTKPAAPTKFSVTADRTTAKLTWEKVSSGNGYEIYMANSRNGSYSKIKNTTYSATFYSKTGLTKGKRYYFKMRAYKLTGTGAKVYSGYSSIKAVTIK